MRIRSIPMMDNNNITAHGMDMDWNKTKQKRLWILSQCLCVCEMNEYMNHYRQP